jgi:hypothetical protein
MRPVLGLLAATALFVTPLGARAQEGTPASEQPVPQAKKVRPSRSLITHEQIVRATADGASSAYDVVQKYRREWFRVRADLTAGSGVGAYSPNRPAVYFDNNLMGDDPELLRQFKPDAIAEIRFLSGPDATTRFGTGYPHGVIQVISSTGG